MTWHILQNFWTLTRYPSDRYIFAGVYKSLKIKSRQAKMQVSFRIHFQYQKDFKALTDYLRHDIFKTDPFAGTLFGIFTEVLIRLKKLLTIMAKG